MAKSEQRTRQEAQRYEMKCGTRNEGADLCDQNENKEAHSANQKWKPRPTKGSEVAGHNLNQKRKEGRAYGSCDKPKGEKPVKGGGDCSDKLKMEGMSGMLSKIRSFRPIPLLFS